MKRWSVLSEKACAGVSVFSYHNHSSVNPLTEALASADDPVLLADDLDCLASCCIHGQAQHKRRQHIEFADFL